MSTIKEAATDFLACRRIAVTGVSREPKEHGANIVFTRLKERGYEVFAVNPNAERVEGATAHHDLALHPRWGRGRRHRHGARARRGHRARGRRPRHHQGLDAPVVRRRQRLGAGGAVRPRARDDRDRRRLPADVRPDRRRRPQGDVRRC